MSIRQVIFVIMAGLAMFFRAIGRGDNLYLALSDGLAYIIIAIMITVFVRHVISDINGGKE